MSIARICIFTETYYPLMGGGETQARACAEALSAQGFPVCIITRRSHLDFKRSEQFGAIAVYRLPPVGRQHYKKWGLLLSSIPALIKRRRQFDVILVCGFRVLGMSAILVSRLFGKVCILKADSLGEMSGAFFRGGLAKLGLQPSSWWFRKFLALRNAVLKQADAFVAISEEIAAELQAHGVRPETIYRIPNSVDSKRFCRVDATRKAALREKLALPLQDRIVIYTGRLVSYKGLPLLLQVWRQLMSNHQQVSLLLVGEGGLDMHNCEAALHDYVRVNGLQSSVHFTGRVENVHEYLQAADIFVFPTESEAFGIALIEAMACGLPVVSTSVGGVKDILQHCKNGLVVEPGDCQALYTALDALLRDDVQAVKLAHAAWNTVQERYTVERVTEQYVALLRQASNGRA